MSICEFILTALSKIFPDKISIFEKLKSIISIHNTVININIINSGSNPIVFDDNEKSLEVVLDKCSRQQLEELKKLLPNVVNQGGAIVEATSQKTIEKIKQEENTNETEKIVSFLNNKISTSDLYIWRAALYLRSIYRAHGEVADLKNEIIKKYGDRGRHITNLCTSKYVEDFFIPYYENLKGEDKDAVFRQTYEDIVKNQPFTIFVSAQMKEEDIINEITAKKSYGMKEINVHGIGLSNIKIVKKVIKYYEEVREKIPNRISIALDMNSISIKIIFLQS